MLLVEVCAEAGTVADAVGEVTGELLHLADCLGPLGLFKHREIEFHDRIAIFLGGLPVSTGAEKLIDLAEDPGVVTGGAADHDGVAGGLFDHADGIFGSDDIAVADDGDFDSVLDLGDAYPIGFASVTLLAGARVESEGGKANIFGHFGGFDMDELIVVPAGAEFHRKWNGDGGLDGFEYVGHQR